MTPDKTVEFYKTLVRGGMEGRDASDVVIAAIQADADRHAADAAADAARYAADVAKYATDAAFARQPVDVTNQS